MFRYFTSFFCKCQLIGFVDCLLISTVLMVLVYSHIVLVPVILSGCLQSQLCVLIILVSSYNVAICSVRYALFILVVLLTVRCCRMLF